MRAGGVQMKRLSDVVHGRREGVGVKMKTMSDIVMGDAEPPRYVVALTRRQHCQRRPDEPPHSFSPVVNRSRSDQCP
jgi:hypothetical protein